jgi:hypothetical protein
MSSTQEVGEIFGQGSGPAHAMLRSPTVLIAAVGLWGMNIYFFRLFGIDYVKVLEHDLLKMAEQGDPSERYHRKESSGSGDLHHHPHPHNGGGGGTPPKVRLKKAEMETEEEVIHEDEEPNFYDEETSIMETGVPSESHNKISWTRLVGLSMSLLFLLHFTYFVWIDVLEGGSIGAVFFFYGAVTLAIVFPLNATAWLRKAAVLVLHRSYELINPRCSCLPCGRPDSFAKTGPRPIPFVDVFFADAMCSLSKVFFDWGMLLHMAVHYPNPVPPSAHNILIPSAFAAVPFLIRARQCFIMWTVCRIRNDRSKYSHLWNALKYSTSIFPLCLSAYQKTIRPKAAQDLEVYLILLLVINALYALYWDIVMDWGMMKNPTAAASVICKPPSGAIGPYTQVPPREQLRPGSHPTSCWHAMLRHRLRFGVSMSVMIILTDAVLRFSWVLRFYHDLFPNGDSFVLCTQFLEVFRRAIWNLLRVEWENLKQSGAHQQPKSPLAQSDEELSSLQLVVQRGMGIKQPSIKVPPMRTTSTGSIIEGDDEKMSLLTQRGSGGLPKPKFAKV